MEVRVQVESKWEGKVSAKLNGIKAVEVWPFLEDFCSINKWLPSLDTSYQVDGVYGQPGLIRYCSTTDVDGGGEIIKWCNEKLVAVDPASWCLTYEILDNNIGFKSYESTIKVSAMDGADCKQGCQIDWSFVADPVDGMSSEDLVKYLEYCVQGMAEKFKDALKADRLS